MEIKNRKGESVTNEQRIKEKNLKYRKKGGFGYDGG